MDKPWLAHYPPGIPADIDPARYRTLAHLLDECFTRYAPRPAFAALGKTLTFAEVDALSRRFAAWLQTLGLAPGARIALMMPNILPYPVAIAGVLRAGYVVVNVNPLYTAAELEHQLRDSGAEAIVILENFAHLLQKVLPSTAIRHVVLVSMGDLLGVVKGTLVNAVVRHVKKLVKPYRLPGAARFGRALAAGGVWQPPDLGPDDAAFLQYTGGTTGVAKGAVLLHRNIVANVMQCDAWLLALDGHEAGKDRPQEVFVAALPLYHIFGLTVCCMLSLHAGGLSVLIPNPRDLPATVRTLARYRFTLFPGVNTLFNALLNRSDFRALDFSALRVSVGGGMAVQRSVAERWAAVTGSPLCEGYGLSETSPVAFCTPITIKEYSGTIGMPLPSTEAVILDDDGLRLPCGERGELALRGPQVMAGYWGMPEETAQAMTADGFFKTGDIAIMDERGHARIVDRKKDMILVSGFNVYPNEVEAVVGQHPGVLECAAVGVPDGHSGEAVKVVVVKRDDDLTEHDLKAFCRERLTGYKRPRQVEFRSELPKSNVGKILRRLLRSILLPLAAGALMAAAHEAHAGVTFRLDRLHAAPGETVRIEAMFFNDGNSAAVWSAPRELILQWRDDDGQVLRTPARLEGDGLALDIPVGRFARVSWVTAVPPQAKGLQAIAIEGEPVLLALDTSATDKGRIVGSPAIGPIFDPAVPHETPPTVPDNGVLANVSGSSGMGLVSTPLRGPAPAEAAQADRSALEYFRSAVSPYEPVYFSFGSRPDLNARFQISLKFRLLQPAPGADSGFFNNLYIGYSQTSLWDIGEDSAPFRDSSYRPAFFWLSDRVWESRDQRYALGFDGGFEHESNGRDGSTSRALNMLYARPMLSYRTDHGSTLSFGPKIRGYLTREGMKDVADYRGHADYLVRWAKDDGLMLSALLRPGREKASLQLDMAYPLRKLGFNKLNGFLHMQYFKGYGETLLDYNVRAKSQLRIGLMVVR